MCTSARERREQVVGPEECGDARLDAGDAASRRRAHHLVFFCVCGVFVFFWGWVGVVFFVFFGVGGGVARLDAGDAASRRRAHHLVFFRERGEPVSPRGWAGDEYPAPHGAGGGVGGGAACVDVVAGQVVFRGLRGRQFGAISARAATTDKTGFG